MTLKERLPSTLPLFREQSRLRVIIEAIQSEITELTTDTSEVKDSLFVDTATGQSLDLIGDDFGLIGQRRGRDDAEYRQFLQGLVPVFAGRGTERDVEIAVAAGVTRDPDVVDLRQDFGNREYNVELLDSAWIAHRTGTTRDLAELADPVAVDLIEPVRLLSTEIPVIVDYGQTEIAALETRSEEITPELTFGESRSEELSIGLSAIELDPLSTAGFILSLRELPTADISFGVQATAIRQMTVVADATFVADDFQTSSDTIQQEALSSNDLPPLSTDGFLLSTATFREAPPATPSAGVGDTVITTLSQQGLSSAELGQLSATSFNPLSS